MCQCEMTRSQKRNVIEVDLQHKPRQSGVNLKRDHEDVLLTSSVTQLETIVLQKPLKTTTELRGLSPRANYTDRETAACRRS
jgi:hypothetical protein